MKALATLSGKAFPHRAADSITLVKGETTAAGLAASLFNPSDWDQALKLAVTPGLGRALLSGAAAETEWTAPLRRPRKDFDLAVEATSLELDDQTVDVLTDRLAYLVNQPFWTNINQTQLTQLETTLSNGIQDGLSIANLERRIRDEVGGMNKVRATRIARTETTMAFNAGQQAVREKLAQDGLASKKQWLSILDDYTREDHVAMNEVVVPIVEPFVLPDASECMHPGDVDLPPEQRINCVPATAEIEGQFFAGCRSLYAGEMAKVVTGSGRSFCVTPEHPVLTSRGWIAAGKLERGDKLLRHIGRVKGVFPMGRSDDEYHKPPIAEELFCAFTLSALHEVSRTQAVNFDGDAVGRQGEVQVVSPVRPLLLNLAPGHARQGGRKFIFVGEHAASSGVVRDRSLLDFVVLPFAPTAGRVRFGDLRGSLGRRATPPFDLLLAGAAADNDALFSEHTLDWRTRAAELFGKLRQGTASTGVLLDDVISVELQPYAGHVYDFQGLNGMMVVDGVIVSNCRCTCVTVIEVDDEEAVEEDDPPVDEIEEEDEEDVDEEDVDEEDPDAIPPEEAAPAPPKTKEEMLALLKSDKLIQAQLEAIRNQPGKGIAERAERAERMAELSKTELALTGQIIELTRKRDRARNADKIAALNAQIDALRAERAPMQQELARLRDAQYTSRNTHTATAAIGLDEADQPHEGFMQNSMTLPSGRDHRFVAHETARQASDPNNGDVERMFDEGWKFVKALVVGGENLPSVHANLEILDVGGKSKGRAYQRDESRYDPAPGALDVALSTNSQVKTVVHEFGHALESKVPGWAEAAVAFLEHRVGNEKAVKLADLYPNHGFESHETGRKDDFMKAFGDDPNAELRALYIGKKYPQSQTDAGGKTFHVDPTEITSMGIELLYRDPVGFVERDPEYAAFILGVLNGRLRFDVKR